MQDRIWHARHTMHMNTNPAFCFCAYVRCDLAGSYLVPDIGVSDTGAAGKYPDGQI